MRHGRDKILNGCSGSISLLRGLGSSRNGPVHPVSRWKPHRNWVFRCQSKRRYPHSGQLLEDCSPHQTSQVLPPLDAPCWTGPTMVERHYSKIDTCHWHNQNRQRTVPSHVILAVCIHECGRSLFCIFVRNLSTDILNNHVVDAWNTLP